MSQMLKSITLFLVLSFAAGVAQAGPQAGSKNSSDSVFLAQPNKADQAQKIPYYGADFFRALGGSMKDGALKDVLRQILNGAHIRGPNLDTITQECGNSSSCYMHRSIGYRAARTVLLGQIYLVQTGKSFAVRDVYCEREYTASDFSSGPKPGPNVIPDENIINIEHTWPQSKFNNAINKDLQKSDLHHLYPADSKMNSLRGNFPFGEVARETKETNCRSGASFGMPTHGTGPVFEPPAEHRGNVARSIFYFSIKYRMSIDPDQEAFLKKWNVEDPVDDEERERNEAIYKIQGSRNPFVDYPELANRISDF